MTLRTEVARAQRRRLHGRREPTLGTLEIALRDGDGRAPRGFDLRPLDPVGQVLRGRPVVVLAAVLFGPLRNLLVSCRFVGQRLLGPLVLDRLLVVLVVLGPVLLD